MNPQDVALWIGIASSIGGAAVGYGTLTEKVASLEESTDPTHLESRLTKLETRIEDNDISHIGTEIEQLRGQIKNTADKVAGFVIPSTSKIKSDIRVLETEVAAIQGQVNQLSNKVEVIGKPSNPLL
jgi:archaellum component FlaC|tara:strand:+ start:2746 stop:3126 length:381 start_codon:yes stop_codon:yes gene_type:complete